MPAEANFIKHEELIAAHRERYRIHAQAMLDGLKEVSYRDDCGYFAHKVDRSFVEGMEGRLALEPDIDSGRRQLCERIVHAQPVPELDAVLSTYVCRLTGTNG